MKLLSNLVGITLLTLLPLSLKAEWAPKNTPIYTKWSSGISLSNPLPEYPRPQMVRTDWQSLNGRWEFKSGVANEAVPHAQTLPGKIVVPFCIESTLSGVVKHYDRVWYRRTFTVPAAWSGKRIILHFGAIDWESEIYINGISVGIHKGGYDAFSYDVTDQLSGSGEQELIVRVYDPTRDYGQPRGKQTTAPSGALYTCVTGIWQTVWMEPVAAKNISSLKLIPDIDKGLINITVNTADSTGLTVTVIAKDREAVVSTVTNKLNTPFSLSIPSAKLWSPESPFLYDLTVVVKNGETTVDSVSSYFGMRKISRDNNKILLNNKFVFQMGPLDQGFWPEGIYTAPTDDALKSDIEQTKALGFNMTRKHIKVEPQRWYYWADKLGLMVWQDMPSANSYDTPAGVTTDQVAHELEMRRMITNHINSPSIIMWVMFNEGCGQFDTKGRVDLAYSLDPSRLVDQGSGGQVATPTSAGDVIDAHRYPDPLCETQPNQASVSGEYGGIFYKVSNHQWGTPNTNSGHAQSSAELLSMYSSLADQVIYLKTNNNLCAAVYTQITDVEEEINGLLTYDRIPKADVSKFRAINERIINQNLASTVDVLPTSQKTGLSWKYTTTQPGTTWYQSSYDVSAWSTGLAGFGAGNPPGAIVRTIWNTNNIWMRRQFILTDLNADELSKLAFMIHHDEDCEIYLNGVLTGTAGGFTSGYGIISMNKEGRKALILNGINTIAVHCLQRGGGQYIDAGIVKLVMSGDTTSALNIKPLNNAINLGLTQTLSWHPGVFSTSHKIYLGTSSTLTEADLLATQPDTFRVVTNLLEGATYYWRVDEVTDGSVKTGYVWSFKTKASSGLDKTSLSSCKIFPNPLQKGKQLIVEFGSELNEFDTIGLWSNKGIQIFSQPISGQQKVSLDLNTNNTSSGVYYIRAEKNGRYSTPQKLVLL